MESIGRFRGGVGWSMGRHVCSTPFHGPKFGFMLVFFFQFGHIGNSSFFSL